MVVAAREARAVAGVGVGVGLEPRGLRSSAVACLGVYATTCSSSSPGLNVTRNLRGVSATSVTTPCSHPVWNSASTASPTDRVPTLSPLPSAVGLGIALAVDVHVAVAAAPVELAIGQGGSAQALRPASCLAAPVLAT